MHIFSRHLRENVKYYEKTKVICPQEFMYGEINDAQKRVCAMETDEWAKVELQ